MAEKTDNAKSTMFRSNAADMIKQQSEPLTTPPPLGFKFSSIKSKASFAFFDAETQLSKSSSLLNNSETKWGLGVEVEDGARGVKEAEYGLELDDLPCDMRSVAVFLC